MSYQNLLTERIDKVALITLNRPEKLNALSYELACEIDEELKNIEDDDEVSVVILTGAGPRAFSAGGDIHQMVKSTPEDGRPSVRFGVEPPGISPRFPSQSSAPLTAWPTAPAHSSLRCWICASAASTPSSSSSPQNMAAPIPPGHCHWSWACPRPRSCSTPDGWSKRKKPSESACSTKSYPAPSCARPRSRWASSSAKTTPAWCKALNGSCTRTSAWIGAGATTTSRARARPISKPTRRGRVSKTFWLGKESVETTILGSLLVQTSNETALIDPSHKGRIEYQVGISLFRLGVLK